ncbi:MAG: hypothetical protein ACXWZ7_20685 [Gemmatirosa sp.]
MLTSAFVSASFVRGSGAVRASPVPVAHAQRPSVLARPRHVPQQLSLFGPPGAIRR